MDLAVRHNSLVNEHVFVQHVRNPHCGHLPLLHNLHAFHDVLEPATVSSRAIELPMNCSSGISNLANFCSLDHVVDFSPW